MPLRIVNKRKSSLVNNNKKKKENSHNSHSFACLPEYIIINIHYKYI